jgi:uncharacterized protein (DUF2147 family)
MKIIIGKKVSALCLCLFMFATQTSHAIAQNNEFESNIEGYWQKEGEAVVMEMKNTDGEIEGIIVRNDWSPGLIDVTFVKELQFDPSSERWTGQIYDTKSNQYRKGSISFKKGNSTISIKVRGRRRVNWLRTQSKTDLN